MPFEIQPRVQVKSMNGLPIVGLPIKAMLVPDESTRPMGGRDAGQHTNSSSSTAFEFWRCVLDGYGCADAVVDIAASDLSTMAPYRISKPSDASGMAEFEGLRFTDGIPGCYRVLFFYAEDPRNDPESPERTMRNAAFSDVSSKICLRKGLDLRIVRQPSSTTGLGGAFPIPLKVQVLSLHADNVLVKREKADPHSCLPNILQTLNLA